VSTSTHTHTHTHTHTNTHTHIHVEELASSGATQDMHHHQQLHPANTHAKEINRQLELVGSWEKNEKRAGETGPVTGGIEQG
jgi:hypothetical protein